MKYFLLPICLLSTFIILGQNTPILTSFPAVSGVTPVIFLDFDGHQIESGNNWSGFTGGDAFDATGSGLTEEDMYITYEVMAEDFRPWKVAVTTDESIFNAAPENARMRVIFTQSSEWYGGGAGGAAFMESFTWTNTPCWVFTDVLGLNGKYAGDAGSHQVGHTLNLPHHNVYNESCEVIAEYNTGYGDAETIWAPIMGASYYSNIGTWDNGKKGTPLNCDLRMRGDVDSITIRLEKRTDDHGSPVDIATDIEPGAISFNVAGIIEEQNDEDAFILTVPEQITMQLSIRNPQVSENRGFVNNLDVKLLIRDVQTGEVHEFLQSKKVGIDTAFTFQPNKTYELVVTNDENEWMTDYGSLGSYVLTGQGTRSSKALVVNLGADTSLCTNLIEAGYQLNADPEGKNPTGTQYTFGSETKVDDPLYTVFQPGVYTVRVVNANTSPTELADTIVVKGISGTVPGFTITGFDSTLCVAYINFEDHSVSCASIDSITMDFGDGESMQLSQGQVVAHRYDREGVYTIKETVYAEGKDFGQLKLIYIKLAKPPVNVLGPDLLVCEGTLGTLSLTNKYEYATFMWTDNASAGSTRRVGPGEYVVNGELKDQNGHLSYCYFSDTIAVTTSNSLLPNFEVVSNSMGFVSFKNTTTSCDGTQPSRYRWIFGNGQESNAVNPTVRFTEFGDVVVTLIASTASESQSIEKVVQIKWAQTPFRVEQLETPGHDLPRGKGRVVKFEIISRRAIANGSFLNIQVEGTERGTYQLLGVDGKLYGKGQLVPGSNTVDAIRVPSGVFFMRVFGGGQQEVIKFIKP